MFKLDMMTNRECIRFSFSFGSLIDLMNVITKTVDDIGEDNILSISIKKVEE